MFLTELDCLQEERDEFSLHGALSDALVQNKDEFVYLFTERVKLKKFLDKTRLTELYNKVCNNSVM